jgi:hypothetical protein
MMEVYIYIYIYLCVCVCVCLCVCVCVCVCVCTENVGWIPLGQDTCSVEKLALLMNSRVP